MLCILEGCDGVGKSTVAEKMRDALSVYGGATVLHKGPMLADAIDEYELPLIDYTPGDGQHIICDRWHLGELVYGPLLRGESRMTEAERRHIDMFLASRGAIILHVSTRQDLIVSRIASRGDDLIVADQVETIVSSYYDAVATTPWQTTIVDMLLRGDDERADNVVIRDALMLASQLELMAVDASVFKTYVGTPRPRVLLLGERRNLTTMPSAFVPKPATSGRYLLDSLTPDVFASCGIANACEEDIVSLHNALGEPMIVALGREAAKVCASAELDFGEVPHPQYVRRFHHTNAAAYGNAIREAAHHKRNMTHVFAS